MCASCGFNHPDPSSPEATEAAKFMAGGLATVADELERQNDMQIRLACLKLAVEVKGKDNDSQKVLASANAYYDFITNKKDAIIR